MLSPTDILYSILEIIDYGPSKEKFINQFLIFCYKKTIILLVSPLEEQKRTILTRQLLTSSPEEIQQILYSNFGKTQTEEALQTASSELFQDYIKDIVSTLSQTQRKNLQVYLESIAFLGK